ncbi:MAG: hypothetical protein M1823_001354 [Watsoniomyces obsoletus]|nr:MAG: hypothetical protein M1823_001354 [Watsoniomyces obsoletus]
MSETAEANRKYWNQQAQKYNDAPWKAKVFEQMTGMIKKHNDWLGVDWSKGSSIRVLDYACGPGTVSQALASYEAKFQGMDVAPNMVEAYNANAKSMGLYPDTMSAVVGNLVDTAPTSNSSSISLDEYTNFDLIVVGMGFHHFPDPPLAAKVLAERLKPDSGVLMIIDILDFDGGLAHFEGANTITRHGFSKKGIQDMFVKAGLTDVDLVMFEEDFVFFLGPEQTRTEKRGFMVKGVRK